MKSKLSAFADEIGPDLNEQIKVLNENAVGNIELRGIWDKNCLELTVDEIKTIKKQATDNGIGFSALGSPLGKFPLDGDFNDQMEDLKKALEYAAMLEAPYIRMFSFFIPENDNPENHRSQVMDWLGEMAQEAEKTDVILAHENEKGIFGDIGTRCLDIYETINSKSFTGVFDFANFVQCGQHPYADCWKLLRPYITYFHIKDAKLEDGSVVPAGKGDGDIQAILGEAYADGYDNFLTLEPHLSVAEASYGRTTPDLFNMATDALKAVLDDVAR